MSAETPPDQNLRLRKFRKQIEKYRSNISYKFILTTCNWRFLNWKYLFYTSAEILFGEVLRRRSYWEPRSSSTYLSGVTFFSFFLQEMDDARRSKFAVNLWINTTNTGLAEIILMLRAKIDTLDLWMVFTIRHSCNPAPFRRVTDNFCKKQWIWYERSFPTPHHPR